MLLKILQNICLLEPDSRRLFNKNQCVGQTSFRNGRSMEFRGREGDEARYSSHPSHLGFQ